MVFNLMIGWTLIMSLTLCGFIFGNLFGYLLLKYFNFDIINNKFFGLYIYFEIGILFYLIIGFTYIFLIKDKNN